ncbi:MAG: RNA polymerase factor sigma-32 [Alphaproteobacteria bacterium]|nr:RNA polymerase factor sigma-32 [Alphaproteobacteria bacterium]
MIDNAHLSKLADREFIRQLMEEPFLEKEHEHELAVAWQENRDEKAFQQIIKSFTRLVVSIALRFRYYGLPLPDLIQEGTLGLMYAAERFDASRDVRFSSYAKWWIRATIQDYVLRNWSIVRTGSTTAQKQLFFNLKRLKNQLENFSMDALSKENKESIAETLHVSIADVENMEKRLSSDLSLNTVVNEASEQNWQDFLPDDKPNPESCISLREDADWRHFWLETALETLDDRERAVIQGRRLQDTPETLEDIGKRLKVSKERVRQIEARALRKMRHALITHISEVKDVY